MAVRLLAAAAVLLVRATGPGVEAVGLGQPDEGAEQVALVHQAGAVGQVKPGELALPVGAGQRFASQRLGRLAPLPVGLAGAGLGEQPEQGDGRETGGQHQQQRRGQRRLPGLHRRRRRACPTRPTGRAWIGSSSRKRRRSSANS